MVASLTDEKGVLFAVSSIAVTMKKLGVLDSKALIGRDGLLVGRAARVARFEPAKRDFNPAKAARYFATCASGSGWRGSGRTSSRESIRAMTGY